MSVSLAQLLGNENRIEDLQGGTPERIITELLEHLAELENLDATSVDRIRHAILAREHEATTGIGKGIAIPHMKECSYVERVCAVFGRSRAGIEFAATDGEPVHLFFLILTPGGADSKHVQIMKKIVLLSRDGKTLQYLIAADHFERLEDILQEIDDQVD